ncbi:TetR/AcrR family transcriptional regulator [Ketobacter sp.]|uniref:TetR/AcrR family transcriptional regulator n=1 Tax=Ketobacter sp. TaxID=2083498 RepID=UPI000F0F8CE4|nr:TetR/AcrR family transcriptional regulator [Ketobacter sp.]MEE2733546.1 TetR/AcrR family transcriptional regulator [Pseudomonadota bacterium]RLT96989.1 MAG: TetR/AcrR family transcriptional regulator [Ketobacter sp.]
MKTKDRILLTSLKMFNEQGERNVSTNHIAAALNISPGNLYYHFRNKNEIVFQLFLRYQQEVQGFMIVPEGRHASYQDKVNYLEAILNSMWDYRFLHRDLQHLLQDDERLRDAYRAFSSRTVADGRRILQAMADAGVLLANQEQIDALILNIWVLVVSWSSFLQSISIQNNNGSTMRKALLKRAIYQIIALEEPFLCESIKPLLPELKKHYLAGESTDPLALFPTILDDVQQR